MNEYIFIKQLQYTGYNMISLCKKESINYVIKKMINNYDEEEREYAKQEINIFKKINNFNHPNLIKFIDSFTTLREDYLIIEYGGITLKEHKITNRDEVISIMKQIGLAIQCLHHNDIIHLDLKPQNIVINNNIVKLIDFGESKEIYNIDFSSCIYVTLWYRAPELLLESKKFDYAIDIWSLGCIFYELLTNKPLFPGDSEIDMMYKIFRILGTPNEYIWQGFTSLNGYRNYFPNFPISNCFNNLIDKDLLLRLLSYDPLKRIKIDEFNDILKI